MKIVRYITLAGHIFCFSIGIVGTIAFDNERWHYLSVLIFNAGLIVYWFQVDDLLGA